MQAVPFATQLLARPRRGRRQGRAAVGGVRSRLTAVDARSRRPHRRCDLPAQQPNKRVRHRPEVRCRTRTVSRSRASSTSVAENFKAGQMIGSALLRRAGRPPSWGDLRVSVGLRRVRLALRGLARVCLDRRGGCPVSTSFLNPPAEPPRANPAVRWRHPCGVVRRHRHPRRAAPPRVDRRGQQVDIAMSMPRWR